MHLIRFTFIAASVAALLAACGTSGGSPPDDAPSVDDAGFDGGGSADAVVVSCGPSPFSARGLPPGMCAEKVIWTKGLSVGLGVVSKSLDIHVAGRELCGKGTLGPYIQISISTTGQSASTTGLPEVGTHAIGNGARATLHVPGVANCALRDTLVDGEVVITDDDGARRARVSGRWRNSGEELELQNIPLGDQPCMGLFERLDDAGCRVW